MIEFLSQPWPWYVSGPLIGLTVPMLLVFSNKTFSVSGSLRHLCAMIFGRTSSLLRYDWWKIGGWNLLFFAGIAIGGFLANIVLHVVGPVPISPATVAALAKLGIAHENGLMPTSLFSWSHLLTVPGFILMVVGGFLVGFGSRWAGGCTSGHGISGLSNLEVPSLIAVCSFFVGGIVTTFALLPLVLSL